MIENISLSSIPLICFTVYLFIEAVHDLRTHEITRNLTVIIAGLGLTKLVMNPPPSALQFCLRLIPGLLFICLSVITHGSPGLGDGLVLIIMALFIESQTLIAACLTALFLSAFYAAILLIKKHSLRTSLPFLPFLFAGYSLISIPTLIQF